jgi:ribosomal protein L7/L12
VCKSNEQYAELLRAGKKIEAIKMVREVTGWGLAQAKDYVDHLERGEGAPQLPQPRAPWSGEIPSEVRTLAAQDKIIEAIKILRAYSGMGLREAKDVVEKLARGG